MAKSNLALGLANLGQDLVNAYYTGIKIREAQDEAAYNREQRQYNRGLMEKQRGIQERQLGLQERQMGLKEQQFGEEKDYREKMADLVFNEKKMQHDLNLIKKNQLETEVADRYIVALAGLAGGVNDKTPEKIKLFASNYLNLFEGEDKYKPKDLEVATLPNGSVTIYREEDGKKMPIHTLPAKEIQSAQERTVNSQKKPGQLQGYTKVGSNLYEQTPKGELMQVTSEGIKRKVTTPGEMPEAKAKLMEFQDMMGRLDWKLPFGKNKKEELRKITTGLLSAGVDQVPMEDKKGNVEMVEVATDTLKNAFSRGLKPTTKKYRGEASQGLMGESQSQDMGSFVEVIDPKTNIKKTIPRSKLPLALEREFKLVE